LRCYTAATGFIARASQTGNLEAGHHGTLIGGAGNRFRKAIRRIRWHLRSLTFIVVVLALITGSSCCWPHERPDLNTYFKTDIGLSDDQIQAIRSGKAVAKKLPSRVPDEIFVFGAVYINATPDAYVEYSTDFTRLREQPGNLAIAPFSSPPKIADLEGFAFEKEDIKSIKDCKPRDCDVQMPESSMEKIRQSIDWSNPGSAEKVNEMLRQTALKRLRAYQQDGNAALGMYNDKDRPTDIAGQFRYILSYSSALPKYLPALYGYLLSYPGQKPANVDDSFYWAHVKFGLKPTLRIVHVVTMRGEAGSDLAYAIAEKQLYASHYFQTALDLTFCIRDTSTPPDNEVFISLRSWDRSKLG